MNEILNEMKIDYEEFIKKADKFVERIKELREENEELEEELAIEKESHKSDIERLDEFYHALKEISRRVQLENADDCLLDVMDIINKVLGSEEE